MIAILSAIAPFVVSGLTQLAKVLISRVVLVGKPWVIVGVAVLSYVVAIGQSALSGNPIDPASVQVLADTLINGLAATGVYFFSRK
jgi:hypothetical protein